jgi:dTDP-3-amino-3,4,6-trideoxy-alpha-D-glucose transaminase
MEVVTDSATGSRARNAEVPFVDMTRAHASIASDLREVFDAILETNELVLGEQVERFEETFARYCGTRHCIGVSSGTAALTLAMQAAGIGPGDEVIVPDYSHIASALAVLESGATPVFCDVRPDTGLIDVRSAADVVGPRTAAILPVHLYGQVAEMYELADLAERHGLLVLEDAAQAPGATFAGLRAGSLGDAAAFSFYPSHNLGALGDGGAVCTDSDLVAERVRRLRNFGQRRTGEQVEVGSSSRLDDLQAAVLRLKLRDLDEKNARRRLWAERYRDALPTEITPVREDPRGECVYHLFPVRVRFRDVVHARLGELGVRTQARLFPALHRQHPLVGLPQPRTGLRVATEWSEGDLFLPMFPELTEHEVKRVGDALALVLDNQPA